MTSRDTKNEGESSTPVSWSEGDVPSSALWGPTLMPNRYQDVRQLGQGGMGTVHLVRDRGLRREVAMKRLDKELSERPEAVQLFVEEAQLSSQLVHPNLLAIHELGTDTERRPYFTMGVVRGETLWSRLHDPERPPGSPERLGEMLEIFLKVCDAVSYAHSRGVIHRDIKPDNIMVGEFGEVYLMDWGLAKVHRPELVDVPRPPGSPLTRIKQGAIGTPSYMPPEQARAEHDRVDERADIFALGAVLYQIVTGRVPYSEETSAETLRAAKERRLVPPEQVPGVFVQRKLARVIERAMAAEPEARFPSVAELKVHVQRFLHGGLHLARQHFAPGQRIVEEGTVGTEAYIITRGACEVFKMVRGKKKVLRRLGIGDVFGELGVISSAPRTATVEATERVTALVLTREVLEESFAAGTWEGLIVKSLAARFRELDGLLTEDQRRSLEPEE